MAMLPATVRDNFIDHLIETGNVSMTARTLGIKRMTAYGWRSDPSFANQWDMALEVARQGVKEAVIETACAMGVGKWLPARDPATDEIVLDDKFEPVMRFETDHVDARVLMKMMDKMMRSEDGTSVTAVQVNNHVHPPLPSAPRLVIPDVVDAEFGEVTDAVSE